MRLTALLCWYGEPPELLDRMVRSLPLAGVDRLIALDGGIELFPGAERRSDGAEWDAVTDACRDVGVPVEVHAPERVWRTEMEKRSELFALAEDVSDWYLVIDADEAVAECPRDLKDRLAGDVAAVTLLDGPETPIARAWVEGSEADTYQQGRKVRVTRRLFRAIPGLRVTANHFTYVTPDGRELWGQRPEPAVPMFELVMDHRPDLRPALRRAQAAEYYDLRNVAGVESGIAKMAAA